MNKVLRNQKGIGLLEIVLAVAIFTVGIASVGHLFVSSYLSSAYSTERQKASFLAREGVEALRSIKGSGFDELSVIEGGGVDYTSDRWQLIESSTEIDQFTREINIEEVSEDQKLVEVIIGWENIRGREDQVILSEIFTSWEEGYIMESELFIYAATAGASQFSTGETYKIDQQGNIVWFNDYSPGDYSFKYDVKVNDQEKIYVGEGAWTGAANAVMKLNSEGDLEQLFDDPEGTVETVAVDLSGNVYAGSYDNNVYKFDSSGNLIWVYEGHGNEVYSVEVDLNGYLYSASHDNQVHKIDSSDASNIWTYAEHSDDLRAVSVDQEGNVFSGGFDSEVHRINPDGTKSWAVTPKEDGVIYGIAVDGDYLYVTISDTAGGDRGVPPEFRKLDKETGETIWVNSDHSDMIYSVAVDKNGYIYTGSNDDTVKKTDPDGVNVWTTDELEGNVYGVDVAPGRYGAGFWSVDK